MKKEDKTEDISPGVKENLEKRQEIEIKFAVGIMISMIILVFFFYWISVESNRFDYMGLRFFKYKQGNLNFYYATMPAVKISGSVINDNVTFYFREDPRKLKDIKINETIILKNIVFLVADPNAMNCEDSVLSGATLAMYLGKSGLRTFGATLNKTEADETNIRYTECREKSLESVIVFRQGEENKIIINGDCSILEFKNCEIMNITERFIMGTYASSQGINI